MVEEKQIYISFERPEYKQGKAELLQCHRALINLQKKVNHLKAIRANKKRYLAQLSKNFAGLGIIVDRLSLKLPEEGLPADLRRKIYLKKEVAERPKKEKAEKQKVVEDDSVSYLDDELLRIQEKLNSLGAE
jgi:hypothetical protein